MAALENTAPAVLWPLGARNGCAVATVRSKWLCCGHFALEMAVKGGLCALEMAALWPLCARNGCAVATGRSKWLRCGHCALELVALWPCTVRSKRLRCGHCALAMAALWPLCARFDCAYLSFGVTVLLRAVLCAASLAP